MTMLQVYKRKSPGFLSDEEKMEYLMEKSGHNGTQYWHQSYLKIYEGAEILIYHFDKQGLLHYDKVFNCTGFLIGDSGMTTTLIDRVTFKLITIDNVPNKIFGQELLMSMPVRCMVEKTFKLTKTKFLIEGMTTAVVCHTRSKPEDRITGHQYAINLTRVRDTFNKYEITQAERRAAIS